MSAETQLFSALQGSVDVHAVVADRIYPDVAPQDMARPYMVYGRMGTEYTRAISGQVLGAIASLSVSCYADTRAAAEAGVDAAITAVTGTALEVDGRAGSYDPDALAYVAAVTLLHFE